MFSGISRLAVFETAAPCHITGLDSRIILQEFVDAGAVLLRNYSFGLDRFEAFTYQFCDVFYPASNRNIRNQLEGDGYSNQVAQSNYILLGHTEGTYRPYPPPPEICFFMCETPPSSPGGETILIDGVKFLHHLPVTLRHRFEQQGLIYEMDW